MFPGHHVCTAQAAASIIFSLALKCKAKAGQPSTSFYAFHGSTADASQLQTRKGGHAHTQWKYRHILIIKCTRKTEFAERLIFF